MKVERKEEHQFTPTTITLQNQEEFDFLYGLIALGSERTKKKADYFDESLDGMMFDMLERYE